MNKYAAFISYSHAVHGELAQRLHDSLQTIGKKWYRRREIRIFSDRRNLGTTPNLRQEIEQALSESEWFIYIASPEAAASQWIRQEIEYWFREKTSERFLIVLADGEIVWDRDRRDLNVEQSSAVPDILLGCFAAEPKYEDLRWAKNRQDMSLREPRFLDAVGSLAATIRNVPKDELIGTDIRQHRQLRLIGWLVGSLVVCLAAAWIVTLELRNRDIGEQLRESRSVNLGHLARATIDESPREALKIALQAVDARPGRPLLPFVEACLRECLRRVEDHVLPSRGTLLGRDKAGNWLLEVDSAGFTLRDMSLSPFDAMKIAWPEASLCGDTQLSGPIQLLFPDWALAKHRLPDAGGNAWWSWRFDWTKGAVYASPLPNHSIANHLSPDKRWLVTVDRDMNVAVWDTENFGLYSTPRSLGKCGRVNRSDPLWLPTFGPRSDWVVHPDENDGLVLSRILGGDWYRKLELGSVNDYLLDGIGYHPDGARLVLTQANGTLVSISLVDETLTLNSRIPMALPFPARLCGFSPSGRWLAAVSPRDTLILVDLRNEAQGPAAQVALADSLVGPVRFSANETWLIAPHQLTDDSLWRLIETDDGSFLELFSIDVAGLFSDLSIPAPVSAIGFSPGPWGPGRNLFYSGTDSLLVGCDGIGVAVWRCEDERLVPIFAWPGEFDKLWGTSIPIWDLKVSTDDRWLMIQRGPISTTLWDLCEIKDWRLARTPRRHWRSPDWELVPESPISWFAGAGRWLVYNVKGVATTFIDLTSHETSSEPLGLPLDATDTSARWERSSNGRWVAITDSVFETGELWYVSETLPARAVRLLQVAPWEYAWFSAASDYVLLMYRGGIEALELDAETATARRLDLPVGWYRNTRRIGPAIDPNGRWMLVQIIETGELAILPLDDRPNVTRAISLGTKADDVLYCELSNSGLTLLLGLQRRHGLLVDMSEPTTPIHHQISSSSYIFEGTVSPDGSWVLLDDGRLLRTSPRPALVDSLRFAGKIFTSRFNHDASWLYTLVAGDKPCLWRITGGVLHKSGDGWHGGEFAAFPKFVGDWLLLRSTGSIRLYNMTTHNDFVVEMSMLTDVSPDHRWFFAIQGERLNIYDLNMSAPAKNPIRLPAKVSRAVFSPDSKEIITLSVDGILAIWSLSDLQQHRFEKVEIVAIDRSKVGMGGVPELRVADDGSWIALRVNAELKFFTYDRRRLVEVARAACADCD